MYFSMQTTNTVFNNSASALKKNQTLLGLKHNKLITDVVVRWNSANEMLQRFLEQQTAVTAALLSPEVSCLILYCDRIVMKNP